MKIDEQNADIIYNINGDVYLHNSPEVIKVLNQKDQEELRELNSIPHFQILLDNYKNKNILERTVIQKELQKKLLTYSELFLVGEPGIGKTTLLYQLYKECRSETIYISARRPAISVLSYLVNSICSATAHKLIKIESIPQGLEWLEFNLQQVKRNIIIDDCEANPELILQICQISKLNNSFVYVTRDFVPFETSGIVTHYCTPFSKDETLEYFRINSLDIPFLQQNDVWSASRGNPLYLFYFSFYQITPLPENLHSYQKAIWSSLSLLQREIITFISLPYSRLRVENISKLIEGQTTPKIADVITSLAKIVHNDEGLLGIFHPSFQEFIIETQKDNGSIAYYQERLGDFFLANESVVEATALLVEVAPEKVEKHFLNVFPYFIQRGDLYLAIKILDAKLRKTETDAFLTPYINYHKSLLYHLLGDKKLFSECINKAYEDVKSSKDLKLFSIISMTKATELFESGASNAIELAENTVANNSEPNSFRASLLVNLSSLYINAGNYRKARLACHEGFSLFDDSNREGLLTCAVNYASCVIHLNENPDEGIEFCKTILIKLKENEFQEKAAILASLASAYRREKNYKKANETIQESIELCQRYKLHEKLIMNLINYANIVRDENPETNESLKLYLEALTISDKYNFLAHKARISWLLARRFRQSKDYPKSLAFAEDAIKIGTEKHWPVDIASGNEEKAYTLLEMNEQEEAIKAFQESIMLYANLDGYQDSYQNSIELVLKMHQQSKNTEAIAMLLRTVCHNMHIVDYAFTARIVLEYAPEDIGDNLLVEVFSKCMNLAKDILQITSFLSILKEYCNKNEKRKALMMNIIDIQIKCLGEVKYSYGSLAYILEPSSVIDDSWIVTYVTKQISQKIETLSIRNYRDELIILSSIRNDINFEIHVFYDEPLCIRLALTLILMAYELVEAIRMEAEQKKFIYKICILMGNDEQKSFFADKGITFNEFRQTLHCNSTDNNIPHTIIVDPNYTKENFRALIYFLIFGIIRVKEYLYDIPIEQDKEQRQKIIQCIMPFFNLINPSIESEVTDTKSCTLDLRKIFKH